jgi:hypothetical protein
MTTIPYLKNDGTEFFIIDSDFEGLKKIVGSLKPVWNSQATGKPENSMALEKRGPMS